jgi:tetratricopeptide (TPR) repeat protein
MKIKLSYLFFLLIILYSAEDSFAQKKQKKSKAELSSPTLSTSDTDIKSIEMQARYIDAMKSKILGNYQDALGRFSAILKDDPKNHAAAFEIARIYFENNQLDLADKYATLAVKLYPYIDWYHFFLAEIKAEKGDFTGAASAYATMVKLFPDDYDKYYDWAYMLYRAKKYKEAVAVYDELEQKIGIQEELAERKMELYLLLKENDNAVREIKKLIDFNQANTGYLYKLGYLYIDINQMDKAIKTFEDILKRSPGESEAKLTMASCYMAKGDTAKARNILKDFFSDKMVDIDNKIQSLIPFIQKMKEDDSLSYNNLFVLELAEIILREHPEDVKAITAKADIFYMMGKKQDAIAMYKKAVQYKGVPINVWGQLFSLLLENEDYESILDYGNMAIQSNPDEAIFYFYKGLGAAQLKQYETAAQTLEEGLTKNVPTEALRGQMLSNLGDACHELKWYSKSDSAFEKALEIDPNNAYTLNNYAYYLSLRKEKLDKAEKMSKKSNLLVENNPAFMDTYAWILYQKKLYPEALKWIEKAIKAMGESKSAELFDHYGDILFRLGRKEDALSKWKIAAELEPEKAGLKDKIEQQNIPNE